MWERVVFGKVPCHGMPGMRVRWSLVHILAACLLASMGLCAGEATPYLFVPRGKGQDDSARLQAILDEGFRWIQIAGPEIQIDLPVLLGKSSRTDPAQMRAYHGFTLEPASGIERVTIHSSLGYDMSNPTNPSFAVFEWHGGYVPAGRLMDQALPRDASIRVDAPHRYRAGDYIYISDTSLDPDWGQPLDGSVEVRAVVGVKGDRLILDRPLRRPHLSYARIPGLSEVVRPVVVICHPIFQVRMRRLTFSGFANIGIHLHAAWGAQLEDIDTRDWRGGTLILLDTGGGRNLISDVHYQYDRKQGDPLFKWGLAVEGQEDTVIQRSSVSGAQTGLLINYSQNTWGIGVRCSGNEINFNLGSDVADNPSIDCGLQSCVSEGSTHAAVALGDKSHSCKVLDQTFREEERAYLEVGSNAREAELDGRLASPLNQFQKVVSLGVNTTALIHRRLIGGRKPEMVIQGSEHSRYRIVDPPALLMPKGKP